MQLPRVPKKQYGLWLILFLLCILLFWKINTRGINEWDEARNGVNAFEMLKNRDWINLYYAGELDTWNAKPPLLIWLIAICYKIFGFCSFSLRVPSALATIGIFIYGWKLLRYDCNKYGALITCAILLCCKAIVGGHVGLTGDFDALLIFFLTANAYYFYRFIEHNHTPSIYLVGLCTGLAFYTKGPPGLIYLPSFLLFGLLRRRNLIWIADRRILFSSIILILIVSSWALLIFSFGKVPVQGHYGSHNAFVTMLVNDTWQRLTSSRFEGGQPPDYFFFFEVIDVRLNIWNYLFYLTVLLCIYKVWKQSRRTHVSLHLAPPMLLFSACIIIPSALLLTFAATKYDWYLAPTFLFIAYIISYGIINLARVARVTPAITALLFLFTFVRQVWYVNAQESESPKQINGNPAFRKTQEVIGVGTIRQDIYLYLTWLNKPIKRVNSCQQTGNTLLVVNRKSASSDCVKDAQLVQTIDDYYFVVR